MKRLEKV